MREVLALLRRAAGRLALAAVAACTLAVDGARADAVTDFYRGKIVTLVIVTATGGVYDDYGRLLGRHLGRHIPGQPTIVIQNMGGAAGIIGANYVFNQAPQDGTVLVNLLNTLPLVKVLGQVNAKIEPEQFNWIGNMALATGDIIVSTRSKAKVMADVKEVEVTMGATSPLALGGLYPKLLDRVLGTKFRLISGYEGTAAVELAIDRGEVDGQAGGTWFRGSGTDYDWFRQGKIRVLAQIGARAADLPDVPLLTELVTKTEDRQLMELFSSPFTVGKPTAVGPKVPAERVAALRQAYMETMRDPAFLADAAKFGIDIDPTSGEDLGKLVQHVMSLPPDLLANARAVMQ
jgi:tripartite-type tricarboxylate transporter receptor subunit TctC